jgi:hypothetical protein
LHLLQSRLIGARVDLCESVALMNGLALRKEDLLHDAADLSPDRHCGQRRDRAQGRNPQLDVSGGRGCHRNGHRPVLTAASTARTRIRRQFSMMEEPDRRDQEHQDQNDDQERDPMPADERLGPALGRKSFTVVRVVCHYFTTFEARPGIEPSSQIPRRSTAYH